MKRKLIVTAFSAALLVGTLGAISKVRTPCAYCQRIQGIQRVLIAAGIWPCQCGCNLWWCKMSKTCVATQANPGQRPCQMHKSGVK